MIKEEWLSSPKTIEKSRKPYAHFDIRNDISSCANYICDPDKVSTHGFYPFIHYEKDMTKFSGKSGLKPKTRDICYASHIDSCIFQYYSFLLNELYIQKIKSEGIFDVPIAYRSDLHKNNIFFSRKAFTFIKTNIVCHIMIGDFTHFFDNLDHQYLKKQWCSLLGVEKLPKDHYAVYKNITRFCKWELEDLLRLNGLENNKRGRKQLNQKTTVLSLEDFHKYRSHISEKAEKGIPQGSPISALLANVYMLEVDRKINEIITALGGLFMRYSDDFIIVLPNQSDEDASKTLLSIMALINETPGLHLEPEKTQFFKYNEGTLENCGKSIHTNADIKKRVINFLGFTFDGQKICIRAKTISKYYYKLYRKAKTITRNGGMTPGGRKISGRNLYERYSIKGANSKRGNFLTYVNRAKREYGNDELIDRDTKRHMQKIRKALRQSTGRMAVDDQ